LEHINTERLTLRKFIIEDIDSMLKNWIADPIIQNAYGEPVFETKESVKIYCLNGTHNHLDGQ
jgi:RimJ/RimL family protein N-acetyltransferase